MCAPERLVGVQGLVVILYVRGVISFVLGDILIGGGVPYYNMTSLLGAIHRILPSGGHG